MRVVEKPWGRETIWADCDRYAAKFMFIKKGHRMSLQYHEKKEETIYVQKGKLIIWLSEDEKDFIELAEGGTYHVKPNSVHRFGAIDEHVYLIEVSTPELDDVVRLADDYKR